MHRGQNWDVTFPSPFNSTVLSALQNLNKNLHWYRLSVPWASTKMDVPIAWNPPAPT